MSTSTFTMPTDTKYVEANGVRFAYRKFGKETGTPLVLLVNYRQTMDSWDPELIGPLSEDRPIILFDNVGVGESSGKTPSTIAEMGNDAGTFIAALDLKQQVDVLGFSIGGYIAQELVLQHPNLVRRLILAGTAPRAGVHLKKRHDVHLARSSKSEDASERMKNILFLFYPETENATAAGMASLKRIFAQRKITQIDTTPQVQEAQTEAIERWADRVPHQSYEWLHEIKQPVLVANGENDIMVPTENSYILAQQIPNAQLIIYPDAGHGFLFQYPKLFAEHVKLFLNGVE